MAERVIDYIVSELDSLGKDERKEKIAEYMKTSSMDFIGVELPDIHRTAKKNIKGLGIEKLPAIMTGLWSYTIFEVRLAAIDVLKEYAKKGDPKVGIELADRWIDDADTWGIIDPLCSPTIGSMIIRNPDLEDILKSWRASENIWRRRASVLPFLYLTLKTQYKPEYNEKILEAVTPHISDKEFFVGKAAGWVLRELSKRDPKLVRTYFDKNRSRMTKLVFREGSKKL